MREIVVVALICTAIVIGCSKAETPSPGKSAQEKPLTEKPFVIGLIPEQNIFKQFERYEPLANYLSEKIGLKIELKILPRYGNIIDNFVSEGMDGAFFGSFTYTLAHSKLDVEVLARPEGIDGTSTYHGVIFARKDSGIRTVEDMKGKRFSFVDKATTAGYLLPLAYFKKNGIQDYRTYLKEAYFTGTHEDAVYDVLNKKADIGAAKSTIFNKVANSDRRLWNELTVLVRSPDVPENGFAVRKDIDNSIKDKLIEALLNIHNDPNGRGILKNFGAQKFVRTTIDDYKPVFKYAKEIGLDLATYNYINE